MILLGTRTILLIPTASLKAYAYIYRQRRSSQCLIAFEIQISPKRLLVWRFNHCGQQSPALVPVDIDCVIPSLRLVELGINSLRYGSENLGFWIVVLWTRIRIIKLFLSILVFNRLINSW